MAYSHGEMWNEEKICKAIMNVVQENKMSTMPTHSEMNNFYGSSALSCAISKHGGTEYFSNVLKLPIKPCESKFGKKFEEFCAYQIYSILGLEVEQMKPRYAYDLLVERAVKIDIKCCNLFESNKNTKFYTFNLEKTEQTCDIFVCYCINEKKEIEKTVIIPSYVLTGKKQLSIGAKSKYDKYIDQWHFIRDYLNFVKMTV